MLRKRLVAWNKIVLYVCVILIFTLLVTQIGLAQEKKIIKMTTWSPRGNAAVEMMLMFEQLAELYSNFTVDVKYYGPGTFGNANEATLAVRDDECQFIITASNNLARFAPSLYAFSLPYIVENKQELLNILEGPFFNEVQKKVKEESGLRVVAMPIAGWRTISNSVRPIKKLADLKGLKIRTPESKTIIEMFKAWGVSPTVIPWGETFTALQQGVADGFDNPMQTIYAWNFYEVQKYLTKFNYNLQSNCMITSEKFWEDLSPELQDALQRAINDSWAWEKKWVFEKNEKVEALLEEKGMIIDTLEDEDVWMQKAKAIWPEFYDICGGKEWVEKFVEAKNKVID